MLLHNDGARSVIRKIVITSVIGALSFPLTNILFTSLAAQFAMAAGVGGVILIVQFLADVERRLAAVEEKQVQHAVETRRVVERGFSKINEATRLFGNVEQVGLKTDNVTLLAQRAAEIGPHAPPLVSAFVQAEMDRMSQFLRQLTEREAMYDGEDRDWLLALTRSATSSIDAISLPAVDAGGKVFKGGFWWSDLGHRYLALQREAVQREVKVRRVFIIERTELTEDPSFRMMCRSQADLGIEVRVLYPEAMPGTMTSYLYDFILFDNVLSYEVTPAAHIEEGANPLILHTRLVLRPSKLDERIERYQQLWTNATPLPASDDTVRS